MFRLLQAVLFKTDSVFDALFACFDETIDFYQRIKPSNSYITVATMQKQNMNWFATVLKLVIFFIILTDLTKFVKFCVDEVFKVDPHFRNASPFNRFSFVKSFKFPSIFFFVFKLYKITQQK